MMNAIAFDFLLVVEQEASIENLVENLVKIAVFPPVKSGRVSPKPRPALVSTNCATYSISQ